MAYSAVYVLVMVASGRFDMFADGSRSPSNTDSNDLCGGWTKRDGRQG